MTLIIIHDTDKQIAALVEPDAGYTVTPVMVGPQAAELLQDFIDAMPISLAGLGTLRLGELWDAYVKEQTGRTPSELFKGAEPTPPAAGEPPPAPATSTPAEPPGGGTEPPAPAPADTDGGTPADPTSPAGSPATPPASEPPQSPPQTATPESTGTPSSAASTDSPAPSATTTTKDCPVCHGAGQLVSETDSATGPCGYCNGSGKVEVPA